MATKLIQASGDRSFLLELLHFAGWRLQVREGRTTTIRALRSGILLEASGSTLPEAAGRIFARAMRSGVARG